MGREIQDSVTKIGSLVEQNEPQDACKAFVDEVMSIERSGKNVVQRERQFFRGVVAKGDELTQHGLPGLDLIENGQSITFARACRGNTIAR